MDTKFFNNGTGSILFGKLKGIAPEMATFDKFLAVADFFVLPDISDCRKDLDDIPSPPLDNNQERTYRQPWSRLLAWMPLRQKK